MESVSREKRFSTIVDVAFCVLRLSVKILWHLGNRLPSFARLGEGPCRTPLAATPACWSGRRRGRVPIQHSRQQLPRRAGAGGAVRGYPAGTSASGCAGVLQEWMQGQGPPLPPLPASAWALWKGRCPRSAESVPVGASVASVGGMRRKAWGQNLPHWRVARRRGIEMCWMGRCMREGLRPARLPAAALAAESEVQEKGCPLASCRQLRGLGGKV